MVSEALDHLGMRECTLGGYAIHMVQFYDKDNEDDQIKVLMFNATSTNSLYMGPSPIAELASQIVTTEGNSGHNVEYVTRLADFVREHIPEDSDAHLFKLDMTIRTKLLKSDVSLHELEQSRRRKGSDFTGLNPHMFTRRLSSHSAYKQLARQPSFLDTTGEIFVNPDLSEMQAPIEN